MKKNLDGYFSFEVSRHMCLQTDPTVDSVEKPTK